MNPDVRDILPPQPTSVDLNGWNVTRDAYTPVQTMTVDTKTVTDKILAALRSELSTLSINAEDVAVAVERNLTPHLAKILEETST
jgi:sulfur carrier protein ThiS